MFREHSQWKNSSSPPPSRFRRIDRSSPMLRLTSLRLPIAHAQDALRGAIVKELGIASHALKSFTVVKRGHDARKKSKIFYVYTLDVVVEDEAALLARRRNANLQPAPDTSYKFVAQAPRNFTRPLVIGAGPCGIFATLLLAQMGFRPILLERGKIVRERTKDTWGLWRRGVLDPGSNVQFGEGGAGTFSDGKLHSTVK